MSRTIIKSDANVEQQLSVAEKAKQIRLIPKLLVQNDPFTVIYARKDASLRTPLIRTTVAVYRP